MSESETPGGGYGHGRRCDYCLEHKHKTRVEDLGSIICSDCDQPRSHGCNADGPDGLRCARPQNHDGKHGAMPDGEIRWWE